jgi:threonine/homoserine/homoserine lactone efflux protein
VPGDAHLLTFALTALVIIVIPGPSVLFIVGRALVDGRRVAVVSVLGNTVGEYAQVVAVAFGIGTLAERSVALFTAIKLLGALYLVYLGLRALRGRSISPEPTGGGRLAPSVRRSFGQGLVVGVSNPKTVIFLAAILPEFVNRSAGDIPGQILVLGLVFSAIALVCDSVWALAAGTARTWFARSPGRSAAIGRMGGLAIIAVGVRLAVTGRHD